MKGLWWKILAVVLILYTLIGGMLFDVPALPILNETIRNLYFHVTMWFGMIILMLASVVYSIVSLNKQNPQADMKAAEAARSGLLLGALGIITGSLWAKFTWGAWWVSDPKLNGAAITVLIYAAYMILRNAIEEEQKRARIAAVYNIFAFVLLVVFLIILPRTTDSLHPGNGGNPAFSTYDLDSTMRWVFYPAIIGWTLLGVWIAELRVRIRIVKQKMTE